LPAAQPSEKRNPEFIFLELRYPRRPSAYQVNCIIRSTYQADWIHFQVGITVAFYWTAKALIVALKPLQFPEAKYESSDLNPIDRRESADE
jgi:hypothetical protein